MKRKINLEIEAPVTVVFAVISILLYTIDSLFLQGKINQFCMMSPVCEGELAFNFAKISSYFRLFCYAFGAISWEVLISNLLFVLLLGPSMEEKYGSVIIGIMMLVSVLFAGVLNSCFCKYSMQGCSAIIYMLVFLNSFASFQKKKIPVCSILIFILLITREFFLNNPNELVGIAIGIAGGLCGSLFALLATPRKKNTNTEADVTGRFARPKKSAGKTTESEKEASEDDKETVIGTLHF